MHSVIVIPVLRDNYCYLVVDKPTRSCLIIDPPEVDPVVSKLEEEGLTPTAIWLTHHHNDHTAGVPGLTARYSGLPVVCSLRDKARIEGAGEWVREGQSLEFAGERATVLELPGHSEGHIAYHFETSHDLFSGDVIFGASCGAVFGPTHSDMYRSVTRVSQLPVDTKLWCGHEYTKNNLRFAEAVLGHEALKSRIETFKVPSVPLHLGEEQKTNPFMNLQSQAVLDYLAHQPGDPEATFKALRIAKDNF